jgi:YD repeat-containing protein
MFDHPIMTEGLNGSHNRTYEARIWISPDAVNLNLEGDNLEFDKVSFRLFTETVRLTSSSFFKGNYIPNPGADVFSEYFNDHFEKFSGLVLRTDEQTGNPVRPLEELKDVAKISGVVLWIKENNISMGTSWAQTFPMQKVNTESAVDDFLFTKEDLELRMKYPITIYNQYGISRYIDAAGTVEKYEYYKSGQLKRKTRIENGQETVLWELKEETASVLGIHVLPQKDSIKIIVMGLILLATIVIYIIINRRRKA